MQDNESPNEISQKTAVKLLQLGTLPRLEKGALGDKPNDIIVSGLEEPAVVPTLYDGALCEAKDRIEDIRTLRGKLAQAGTNYTEVRNSPVCKYASTAPVFSARAEPAGSQLTLVLDVAKLEKIAEMSYKDAKGQLLAGGGREPS